MIQKMEKIYGIAIKTICTYLLGKYESVYLEKIWLQVHLF